MSITIKITFRDDLCFVRLVELLEPENYKQFISLASSQQFNRLILLTAEHALSYFLSNGSNPQNIFDRLSELTKTGMLEGGFVLIDTLDYAATNTNRAHLKLRLRRITRADGELTFEWYSPTYMLKRGLSPLQLKEYMTFHLPFICGTAFKTSPSLPKDKRYAYAEFDFEYEYIRTELKATYVKNLALALQKYIEDQSDMCGATLVLRGRIPTELLRWLRGSSPINPSTVPSVEVIFALPLLSNKRKILKLEYWFPLKHGTRFRLKKANSELRGKEAGEIFRLWNKLREYVVVDQIIREAQENAATFSDFVKNFWKQFLELQNPTRQYPHLSVSWEDKDLNKMILLEQISAYKEELLSVGSSNYSTVSAKSQLLLAKMEKTQDLNEKVFSVLQLVTPKKKGLDSKRRKNSSAAKKTKAKKLFFLDWSHIIYDVIKKKDYSKKPQAIAVITPGFLNRHNDVQVSSVKQCYVHLDSRSREMRVSVSAIPNDNYSYSSAYRPKKNLFHNLVADYAVFNMLLLAGQMKLISKEMSAFWHTLLSQLPSKLYSKFYQLLYLYKKVLGVEDTVSDASVKSYKPFSSLKEFSDSKGSDASDVLKDFKYEIQKLIVQLIYDEEMFGDFSKEHLISFMKCLEDQLKQFSQGEPKEEEDIFDDEDLGMFSLFTMQTDVPISNAGGACSTSGETSDNDKASGLSSNKFIALLETTPLASSQGETLSLADIKCFLDLVGKRTHKFSRESGRFKQLSKFGLLPKYKFVSYIYFTDVQEGLSNLVKCIYVIDVNDNIYIANEKIGVSSDPDRPTHSELAKGQGVQAAGELIFYKVGNNWHLLLINNGSGHYRPPAIDTLPLAKEKILAALNKRISTDHVRTLNSLKPGMALASGWGDLEDMLPSADLLSLQPKQVTHKKNKRKRRRKRKGKEKEKVVNNFEMDEGAFASSSARYNQIGLRKIPGFVLNDVNDRGNCFYDAVIDQFRLLGHPFLKEVNKTTHPRDSLRLKLEGKGFCDRQWADDVVMKELVLKFDVILAVIDTRFPERGFICRLKNANNKITEYSDDDVTLPNKPIIRIAATGNHFLSVRKHPKLNCGSLRTAFSSSQKKKGLGFFDNKSYSEKVKQSEESSSNKDGLLQEFLKLEPEKHLDEGDCLESDNELGLAEGSTSDDEEEGYSSDLSS